MSDNKMVTNEGKEVPYPKVGDTVIRLLAGQIPMELTVTKVDDELIHCGAWTFDAEMGIEVDEDLGWGPKYGFTGSYISEVKPK